MHPPLKVVLGPNRLNKPRRNRTMPDTEFAQHLSALAETAKQLNAASDSITRSISTFQAQLRSMNIGLPVWVVLGTEAWMEEVGGEFHEGEHSQRGEIELELGFIKHGGDWILATRRKYYTGRQNDRTFLKDADLTPLLQETRDRRIDALALFPILAKEMHELAVAKLAKVADAEAFLK